jgi:hypothetical protein
MDLRTPGTVILPLGYLKASQAGGEPPFTISCTEAGAVFMAGGYGGALRRVCGGSGSAESGDGHFSNAFLTVIVNWLRV